MSDEKIALLAEGKFMRLLRRGRWEYAARARSIGAVLIVPVTDDGKLLLIEQFRVPLQCQVIELPAGLVGDEPGSGDEAVEAAAGRELIEETGYQAACVETILSGPASPGFSSEEYTLVRATGLTRVGAGGGIEGEDIIVHEMPLADVPDWLDEQRQQGKKVDPRIYTGLWFASQ